MAPPIDPNQRTEGTTAPFYQEGAGGEMTSPPPEGEPSIDLPGDASRLRGITPPPAQPRWPYGADEVASPTMGDNPGLKGEIAKDIKYDGKGSASGTVASSEIVVKDSSAFQAAVIKLMSGQSGFSDLPGVSGLKSSPDGTNRWKLSWKTTNAGLTVSTSIVVTIKEGSNKAGVKFFQVKWEADSVGNNKPGTAYFEPNSGFLVVEMPEGKPSNLIWKISDQKLEYAHLAEGEQKGIDNKLGNTAEVRKGISDYVDALFIKIGGFAK